MERFTVITVSKCYQTTTTTTKSDPYINEEKYNDGIGFLFFVLRQTLIEFMFRIVFGNVPFILTIVTYFY